MLTVICKTEDPAEQDIVGEGICKGNEYDRE